MQTKNFETIVTLLVQAVEVLARDHKSRTGSQESREALALIERVKEALGDGVAAA